MALAYGAYGAKVGELQTALNLLPPTKLAPLAVDNIFGSRTHARVKEFQSVNSLTADGIVGPLTWGMITQLLDLLKINPQAGDVQVRSLNQEILGLNSPDNLIPQFIQPVSVINKSTFIAGNVNNVPQFSFVPLATARLGIFAARKGASPERAFILVLPAATQADTVVIGISHGFGQNAAYYNKLGWANPVSPPLIHDVLLRHVIKRWGAQVIASQKPRALLHIVRAAGVELGPFAEDGAFVRDVLTAVAGLTGNAFSFANVEAFTYSSGINDFNPFVSAIAGTLNVTALYNCDPAKAMASVRPGGAVVKQYLSGQTGGPRPGFEYMPIGRWKNETFYAKHNTVGLFSYLHGFCMPQYTLHLGLGI